MIKGLRKKFILVGMLSVIIAELLMIGTIDAMNYRSTLDNLEGQMQILIDNKGDLSNLINDIKPPQGMGVPQDPTGQIPQPPDGNVPAGVFDNNMINGETPFMMRYFSVTFDASGEIVSTDTKSIVMIDEAGAQSCGRAVYDNKKTAGFYADYYYSKTKADDNEMVIFLDCRRDIDSFITFRNTSIIVGVVGTALVFLILVLVSGRVLAPVEESYKKQKQFITDASHEIKTPLAIISADAEVLELENEENEWIISIKNQVKRLSELTEKLVFLSRMDEGATQMTMTDLDLSKLLREASESYIPMAEASGKMYEVDIEDGVRMSGDKAGITQMINLLVDNAFKYSDENGHIRVSLKTKGRKKQIKVYNTVESIEKGDLKILFERFYRADTSHNSDTGGNGIGLSVVAAIAEAHHGTAEARSEDGRSVTFTINL
ncbi:MAG: HAMP domain-containing histidine kinase [Lachnospiraceae bacterium]|nr:HAMP domain-containing histidine kinase [Lachnospiraceae bacterium]